MLIEFAGKYRQNALALFALAKVFLFPLRHLYADFRWLQLGEFKYPVRFDVVQHNACLLQVR